MAGTLHPRGLFFFAWHTEMAKRRRRESLEEDGTGLLPSERVCEILRDIQWETNCSTLALQGFLDSLCGRLGQAIAQCKTSGDELPRSAKAADKTN